MTRNDSQEDAGHRPNHVEPIYRKATPLSEAKRYPGFKTETKLLPRGHQARKGALPLPCDIQAEFDTPVRLRDGVTIYIDIYRPPGATELPVVLAYAPYGKRGGAQSLDGFPFRMGVGVSRLSGLEAFEAADPAFWCEQGYAVVFADARGAFMSEGDIEFWGSRNGEDAHDVIEWLAEQPWCNGRIGIAGNSWLAMIQWYIAAANPPHLAAIAPWEGVADFYRYGIAWGGFADAEFNDSILRLLYGNNRIEDIPAMVKTHPLINDFWEDKRARTENITVPAYVVSSYSNGIHSLATILAYQEIASKDKWLRIHNTHEWPDFYDPASRDDLKRFFDRYLKGLDNGWEKTPRVRLSVLDPERKDIVNRPSPSFPPPGVRDTPFYLDAAAGAMQAKCPSESASVRYRADRRKEKAEFTVAFDEDAELIGNPKLKLWVEADGADDMDLFVRIEKLDAKGKLMIHMPIEPPSPIGKLARLGHRLGFLNLNVLFYRGPVGRIRVSCREIDPKKSTPTQPHLTHRIEQRLKAGEIVPVEIRLWPMGLRVTKGEKIRVAVSGSYFKLMPELPDAPTRNKGVHIIHTGGKFDSHLLLPIAPHS